MSLSFRGQGGELRHGSRVVARLAWYWKQDRRVTFESSYVNAFAAGLGPPTAIVLPVTPTARRVYPVVSGGIDAGTVHIDLDRATTEMTT